MTFIPLTPSVGKEKRILEGPKKSQSQILREGRSVSLAARPDASDFPSVLSGLSSYRARMMAPEEVLKDK